MQIMNQCCLILLFLIMMPTAGGRCLRPGPAAPSGQKSASYQELFQLIWQGVNDNFYDPSFTGVDWVAVRNRYRPKIDGVKDDVAFYTLVAQMLKEIPASHLELRVPAKQSWIGIGAVTHTVQHRQIVTSVVPASDAQHQGIRPGDLILNSDAMYGSYASTATLQIQGCDGKVRSVDVRRENALWPPERPSLRWHTIRLKPDEAVGYIRAVQFEDDVAPLVDRAMEELRHTSSLIIDVRDNSGGNASCLRLSSYFSGSQHAVAALLTRQYLERYKGAPDYVDLATLPKVVGAYTTAEVIGAMQKNGGGAALFSEDMGQKAYPGKVVVLINERTGSAAEAFAWHMLLKTKATLVGRTTAGALLGGESIDLPGGWTLTVPFQAVWGPDGKAISDRAVKPHINVQWTAQDVCEGRDPDVAKALEVLAANSSRKTAAAGD